MGSSGSRRDTIASRLMVPIVVGGVLITLLGATYLVTESRRTIEKQALQSAESISYQIAQDRKQYLSQMESGSLDPTFLHTVGMSVDGKGLYRVNLLGIWPLESAHNPRDEFETKAIQKMLADPAAVATRTHTVQGEPSLSYMRVENASLQMCVDCHASSTTEKSAHYGAPHFALGAPIGALVVEVPLGKAIAAARMGSTVSRTPENRARPGAPGGRTPRPIATRLIKSCTLKAPVAMAKPSWLAHIAGMTSKSYVSGLGQGNRSTSSTV